jgi:hypothetical protein
LPEARRCAGRALGLGAEHVRVAPDHLGGDGLDHLGEGERAFLLGHARVIDDLQQEIAQLVLQRARVTFLDGVGDLVSLLDGVGRDRLEGLLQVPGAAAARRAQRRHDGQEIIDRLARAGGHCDVPESRVHG